MQTNSTWIPLFPLNTVLFPGGVLPLKVFETRYVDMVRDCMRREVRFGIVLIKSGREVGPAAEPEAVGCLASISRWDMEKLGLLILHTEGSQRFRILQTRELPDHRLEARVAMIAADKAVPVSAMHVRCAKALKLVIDDINSRGEAEQGVAFVSPFATPPQLDDAGWVANRWCEILPIPLKARQKLLELEDAGSRLSVVDKYLQQHKIL
ncbi:MAG TPA: ATP-dependent protease [Oxalobacteraceae bacterium]|jgi:Lon protease-like protein|nr:ATP-dependent protease [Oxalobacteraceae bacterium]HCN87868.1 ATP-dependent protease [Oxalobacteraceae bacterium]